MKKVLAVFLAAVMLLAVASASALEVGTYDPASAGDYEMGFAWWGNQVRDAATKEAADLFTENYPNVTFNLNAQIWSNYWTLMTTASANNDLPDIMQQDYAYLEQWVEAGDLLDLTPYIESGALDLSNVPQNIIDTGKIGDGIYAVCAGVNAPAMLYNKTLTDELGITIPDNITWDQFVDISKQIYEARGQSVVLSNLDSENPVTYYARSLGYQALWDANGAIPTAEEMTEYYARILQGVAEGWMMNTDQIANVSIAGDIAQNPLVFGATDDVRTWCSMNFSNQIAAFQAAATADGIELGITAWPSSNPTASNYMKPSQFFSVTTDTKNPDLAVAFLNYLINDPQANIKLRAERGVPANSKVAAEIADTITSEIDATYGLVVDYLAFVEKNSSPIFPPLPAFAGTANADIILPLMNEALLANPEYTAEQLGQDFVDQVNDLAASY